MIDLCNTMDAVILENDIDLVLQQIEILFDTSPGDVLGDYRFGTRFEDYLFDISLGNHAVASQISSIIRNNVDLMGWDLTVEVDFLAGSQNDILMFRVTLSKDGDAYSKIYSVTQGDVSKYTKLLPVA